MTSTKLIRNTQVITNYEVITVNCPIEKSMSNSVVNLILVRGLPGSGKTTLSRLLSKNGNYPVFSIDEYFTDTNGNYTFDYAKNYLAYKACEENTERAILSGNELVFVDHTFTIEWEMEPYFKLAEKYNCVLHVITVENYHGNENVHHVSKEQILKMAEKYKVKLICD